MKREKKKKKKIVLLTEREELFITNVEKYQYKRKLAVGKSIRPPSIG